MWRFFIEGIEGLILSPFVLLTWFFSFKFLDNWGSLPYEQTKDWEGDELVSRIDHVHTRAITINAPSHKVWPFLTHFGFDISGFFSYELLERLIGIPVTNLEPQNPTMIKIKPGDKVILHPKAPGIPVAFVKEKQYLCFGEHPKMKEDWDTRSWSFYIEGHSDSKCRLILRGCFSKMSTWKKTLLFYSIEEPIDFIMEQRMLRTIKRLVELRHTGG